jgi:hypothetical protein
VAAEAGIGFGAVIQERRSMERLSIKKNTSKLMN